MGLGRFGWRERERDSLSLWLGARPVEGPPNVRRRSRPGSATTECLHPIHLIVSYLM
jgi:hypothetical protein